MNALTKVYKTKLTSKVSSTRNTKKHAIHYGG